MQEMGKGGMDLHVPPFLPIRHNKKNVFLQGTASRQGLYVLNRNTLHGLIVQAGIPSVNGKRMEENMAGSLPRASFFHTVWIPVTFLLQVSGKMSYIGCYSAFKKQYHAIHGEKR